ncbi:class I SAM-dependent methyltransferase [Butyrivibrio sp. WCD3002]|uniref:class I SAM-dependent methyltransferase n=1 Tax=Butyrivibrio sp. WCD3002 TaxID=1280676 RepID=UPI000409219C|nr:class I SAM-dependent methyltransferase [Butyrivibrio sp. WCD3002]
MEKKLTKDIQDYWDKRSETYSELNITELNGSRKNLWQAVLTDLIQEAFPDKKNDDIRILDIGTGPGFFSILLKKCGYDVTGIDSSIEMLNHAKSNAGTYKDDIAFLQMDADELSFKDESFDVVINRNVTWNLQNPEACYAEWKRVLKPGGRLFVFDANWYAYLFDDEKLQEYEEDRENVKEEGLFDFNNVENAEKMEQIAMTLPLSKENRPEWDESALLKCGFSAVSTDTEIWQNVWDREEQINFGSTPMFLIQAVK